MAGTSVVALGTKPQLLLLLLLLLTVVWVLAVLAEVKHQRRRNGAGAKDTKPFRDEKYLESRFFQTFSHINILAGIHNYSL